jgi:hypothetical protein
MFPEVCTSSFDHGCTESSSALSFLHYEGLCRYVKGRVLCVTRVFLDHCALSGHLLVISNPRFESIFTRSPLETTPIPRTQTTSTSLRHMTIRH